MKRLGISNFAEGRHSRSGMALVIVLGLISLLLISSVTFAIMMRIERASSANARNTIMARQAAKGALSYAIAAIDQQIGTNKWARWHGTGENRAKPAWSYKSNPMLPLSSDYDFSSRREPQFWKDTFGSVDHAITTNLLSRRAIARIFSDRMQNYIPFGIRHRAYAQCYKETTRDSNVLPAGSADKENGYKYVIAPEWVPMTSGTNAVNLNNVIGRSAFLAFNTSGYLDIPAVCAQGSSATRRYGASPSEIQLVDKFLASGNSDRFKDDNKGRPYETVADIATLRENKSSASNKENGTVFSDGAAYSAFNFAPNEKMPTNLVFKGETFPFLNKICIAGDGGEEHIKSLRRHKAAIIAAFMRAGLTASSDAFSYNAITDEKCNDSKCTVCGGNAAPFTLPAHKSGKPAEGVSEQALWAYLGLIDYVDDDDIPEGNDEYDKFARPATENTPLFNGFMAMMRFTVEELANEVEIIDGYDEDNNPIKRTETVFDATNYQFSVEFEGKVVFANRSADIGDGYRDSKRHQQGGNNAKDDIFSRGIQAKMGFLFGGDLWDSFSEKMASGTIDNATFESDLSSGLYMVSDDDRSECHFEDGPVRFNIGVVSNKVAYSESGFDPTDSDEAVISRMEPFPEKIWVAAAGRVFKDDSFNDDEILHSFPAVEQNYDLEKNSMSIDSGEWLVSTFVSENEGGGTTFDSGDFTGPAEEGDEVYATYEDAVARSDKKHTLKTRTVRLILWGEPLDPRFSCTASAEEPGNPQNWPRTAFVSHMEDYGGYWDNLALAHVSESSAFDDFRATDELHDSMSDPGDFDLDFEDFKADKFFFPKDYFYCYDSDYEGRMPGFSRFQEYFLTHKETLDKFKGVTDGSRRTEKENDGIGIDDMEYQFASSYVRNDGLDSPGELGFLPIGPYATIRLFGFKDERDYHRNGIDDSFDRDEISLFNQVTKARPFHRVLDCFSATNTPMRGKINLNGDDPYAVASAFNGAPLDDFLHEAIEYTNEAVGEDAALEVLAPAMFNAFAERKADGIVESLSDIGWMYDTDETTAGKDLYADLENEIFQSGGAKGSNLAREALIRNSCGLFTTRGLNFTVIVRGEAFTPFFGRSDVRNDLGTTLASRTAIAQLWRDTEPDDDGNYPFFIQYFKIFDE